MTLKSNHLSQNNNRDATTNKEENVYDLSYLFKTPDQMLGSISSCSLQSLDNIEQGVNCQYTDTKLQVIDRTSSQHEIPELLDDEQKNVISKQADKIWSKNTSKEAKGKSKSTSDFGSDLIESSNSTSSVSVISNHKIELGKMSKTRLTKSEDILKSQSSNSVVALNFRIIHSRESKIFETCDDDDDKDTHKTNIKSSVQRISQELLHRSQNNAKIFTNNNNSQTSKSCSALNTACHVKVFRKNSNNSSKPKIYYLPLIFEPHPQMQLKSLVDFSTIQKNFKLKALVSENYPPTFYQVFKSNGNPSIGLKIYSPSSKTSTQVYKSEKHIKPQVENDSNIENNEDPNNLVNNSKVSLNDYDGRDLWLSRDFTQNIIEIVKYILKTLKGVIHKLFKTSPPRSISCETEGQIKSNHNPGIHFHIKLEIYNVTPDEAGSRLYSVYKEDDPYISDTPDIQRTNLKLCKSKRTKTLNINNEFAQKPAEGVGKMSIPFSTYPKVSKNRVPVFLRQRQLELHNLRVQIKQKRLKILDLKLEREYQELQREKFIFEKYFLPKRFQFQTSNDSVDV